MDWLSDGLFYINSRQLKRRIAEQVLLDSTIGYIAFRWLKLSFRIESELKILGLKYDAKLNDIKEAVERLTRQYESAIFKDPQVMKNELEKIRNAESFLQKYIKY